MSETRTATVTATTKCRVAAISGDELDPAMLAELAGGHRREETAQSAPQAGEQRSTIHS